jgi:hypothetical protein
LEQVGVVGLRCLVVVPILGILFLEILLLEDLLLGD